jgi:hypothetical protein
VQEQPHNNSFEDGLTHWTSTIDSGGSGSIAAATDQSFDGSTSAKFHNGVGPELRSSALCELVNDFMADVKPGQVIKFQCYLRRSNVALGNVAGVADGGARIYWYDSSHQFISYSVANTYPGAYVAPPPNGTPPGFVGGSAPFDAWVLSQGTGTAPAGAAYAAAGIALRTNNTGGAVWVDAYTWNYTHQGLPTGLVFVATQSGAATSAATEPVWPLESGLTVVDGGVTWEGEFASRVVWQASPILESGDTEPTWPTTIGSHVVDALGTAHAISWVAVDGRVTDTNCPQSKIVAIAQSKVYAADVDTIPFSATTNPLDWTTANDAGYLPFGLQSYGAEPCAALGLYRSNLVAMNSLGYQMWQIDPDPANMALLDAQPVGSKYPKSLSPVQNDLVFLTNYGIRSLGISGQSGNIQAGQFGKNLDPLVIASIATGLTPRGLFYPGTGQYWLCFGNTVYVQTNNGSQSNSWGMYEFPSDIDYWTVADGVLYLRSGDLVWQVNENALFDDVQDPSNQTIDSVAFTGTMQWQYLDFGTLGQDKGLEGFDIVCTGTGTLAVGWDETNFNAATVPFAFDGDTLPGLGGLPFELTAPSIQVRLTFDAGQAWEWEALNAYINTKVAK